MAAVEDVQMAAIALAIGSLAEAMPAGQRAAAASVLRTRLGRMGENLEAAAEPAVLERFEVVQRVLLQVIAGSKAGLG